MTQTIDEIGFRRAGASNETGERIGQARKRRERQIEWQGYVFVGFFLVPFFLFNVGPIIFGLFVSFTEWSIIGSPEWLGMANYAAAVEDPWAHQAFGNVLLYGLIIVPGVVLIGLGAALFVNSGYPLSGIARTLFFAPHVVSATVIGLVWVWMLDTRYGLINVSLASFGVAPIPWLTSTEWVIVAVSMASIWWDMGLAFVILLAALQDVPKDLLEAAKIDGANRFNRFRFVTLPAIRPALSMVITLQLIATLRIFSQIYVMTNGAPAGASTSPIHYIYNVAIERYLFGYAAAIGVLLFILIMIVTVLNRTLLRETA